MQQAYTLIKAKEEISKLKKLEDLDGHKLVAIGRGIGEEIHSDVSATQLYKFHEHIVGFAVKVEAQKANLISGKSVDVKDAKLLSYHLAYAAARIKKEREKEKMKELANFFDVALDKVETANDLVRLRQLSEAIVAYHKYAGGR